MKSELAADEVAIKLLAAPINHADVNLVRFLQTQSRPFIFYRLKGFTESNLKGFQQLVGWKE